MCPKRLRQWLISPPDPVLRLGQRERVSEIVESLGKGAVIMDIGARSHRWPEVLALDYAGADVDLIGDAQHLPFADGALDGVISTYVLEHLPVPEQAVAEMHRVLRPGGVCYVETPFLFNFHGHEHAYSDYTRWTHVGLGQLFRQFSSIETGVTGGTASAIAHVLREGIPILLTSGDSKVYWGLRALLGWLLAPLRLLDRKTLRHPKCSNVAAALYGRAVK
jgi:SAM-dependent methyltransferase